jgi:hypothetical protein
MAMSSVPLDDTPPSSGLDETSNLGNSYPWMSEAHSEIRDDAGDIIRDIIIGFADGVTVPFALTAGLSS